MKQVANFLSLLFLSLLFSGCFYNSEPRPDYNLTGDLKVTSSKLPAYTTPVCVLAENTLESSYLNYMFNITHVKKYGRDSIVAWDANNRSNRIKLNFQRIYDQDGFYVIKDGGFQKGIFMAGMEIKGNSLGPKSQRSFCTSGKLYIKKVLTGWDIVICDATFEYNVLSSYHNGVMSAHWVAVE